MKASEIIEKVLNELDIKAPTFAKNIGIKYRRIFDIQNEKTQKISSGVANAIINTYPHFNLSWLLTGEGAMLVEEPEESEILKLYRELKSQEEEIKELKIIIKEQDRRHKKLLDGWKAKYQEAVDELNQYKVGKKKVS